MVHSVAPSSSPHASIASQYLRSPRQRWRPGWRQAPWNALASVVTILACVIVSILIISISDKQPVESWKFQPAVLLAVVSSIANVAYAAALYRGIATTWWRDALHGTNLKRLHYIWGYGYGGTFKFAPSLGMGAYKIGLATIVAALATLGSNPILQRSTHSQNQDILKNTTMLVDIPLQILDGFPGIVQYGVPANTLISPQFLAAIQSWYWQGPMSIQKRPGYYCNGTCEGYVSSPGIHYNCFETSTILDLTLPEANGEPLFSITFDRFENSSNHQPILGMNALYASSVDASCNANISLSTCNISAAIVKRPIKIVNDTIILDLNKTTVLESMPTSMIDSPTAAPSTPAGPLSALHWLAEYYFRSNATLGHNLTSGLYMYLPHGTLAHQFFDTNFTSHKALSACGFQWIDPRLTILRAMGDVLFRAGIIQVFGAGITQNFTATETTPTLVFHSNYAYLAGAIILMLTALVALTFPLWGWWELGRDVSLSPLETAKAFGAPMLQQVSLDMGADGLVKQVGDLRVKYGGVRDSDETGLLSPRMEIGDPGIGRKPYKGEGFGSTLRQEWSYTNLSSRGDAIERANSPNLSGRERIVTRASDTNLSGRGSTLERTSDDNLSGRGDVVSRGSNAS
jgi:hypothetical protein